LYSHCIFCKTELGSNEAIEKFPIGRRLAFDAERGRLWVVCRRCERWNLTPLEERWEAIEQCERAYRATRTRISTEHVGLARVADHTDLIRVGKPQLPEFAAWRYGEQLVRRRRRFWYTMVGGAAAVAVGFGAPLAAAGVAVPGVLQLPNLVYWVRSRRIVARVDTPDGQTHSISRMQAQGLSLRAFPADWLLQVPYNSGKTRWKREDTQISLTSGAAVRLAALLLPHVNASGAKEAQIQGAVKEIQQTKDPEHLFQQSAAKLKTLADLKLKYVHLKEAPAEIRLALEMASHEAQERRALEGELAELEAMWREAEEIAHISDNLLLPPRIAAMFER
jgi:hypothetical protein